jgi:hypothetical protein
MLYSNYHYAEYSVVGVLMNKVMTGRITDHMHFPWLIKSRGIYFPGWTGQILSFSYLDKRKAILFAEDAADDIRHRFKAKLKSSDLVVILYDMETMDVVMER